MEEPSPVGGTIPKTGDSKLYESRESELSTRGHAQVHCFLFLTEDLILLLYSLVVFSFHYTLIFIWVN